MINIVRFVRSSVLLYLYPAETSLDLQLLNQLPCLADTHGAVHWGVSFHSEDKHSKKTVRLLGRHKPTIL